MRQFIKENGKYFIQMELALCTLLEQRTKSKILRVIGSETSATDSPNMCWWAVRTSKPSPSTTNEKGETAMPYKILCWIPVEEEEPEIYKTRAEAEKELKHLSFLQPENIYEVEEVEEP